MSSDKEGDAFVYQENVEPSDFLPETTSSKAFFSFAADTAYDSPLVRQSIYHPEAMLLLPPPVELPGGSHLQEKFAHYLIQQQNGQLFHKELLSQQSYRNPNLVEHVAHPYGTNYGFRGSNKGWDPLLLASRESEHYFTLARIRAQAEDEAARERMNTSSSISVANTMMPFPIVSSSSIAPAPSPPVPVLLTKQISSVIPSSSQVNAIPIIVKMQPPSMLIKHALSNAAPAEVEPKRRRSKWDQADPSVTASVGVSPSPTPVCNALVSSTVMPTSLALSAAAGIAVISAKDLAVVVSSDIISVHPMQPPLTQPQAVFILPVVQAAPAAKHVMIIDGNVADTHDENLERARQLAIKSLQKRKQGSTDLINR